MATWGTKQTGELTILGSPKAGTVADGPMEVGKVYEYYAETSLGWGLDLMTSTILGLQTTFQGLQVLYYNVNESTGIVNFQYWYPPTAQNLELARAQALPLILAVIAVVAVVIAAFLILDYLGIYETGVVDIFDKVIQMLPGMVITCVGGVITSVLPGKTKIAGVVPLGIGLWLMVEPWLREGDEQRCSQYTNQTDCEANGCYWWGGSCHATPRPCSDYTTQTECEAAGCYWWSNACHSSPEAEYVAEVSSVTIQ